MTSLLRAPVKRVSRAAPAGLQIGPGERPAPVRRGAAAGCLPIPDREDAPASATAATSAKGALPICR